MGKKLETKIYLPSEENIKFLSEELLKGELVAFSTETVYGLGANALDEEAVKKIYIAKGRPSDNPLIVHLGEKKKIEKYAVITDDAKIIIDQFMPGAITIILKKRRNIPKIVTGGKQTVGIRIPENETALKFLRTVDVPVCAPSANTSTKPSPTMASHVLDDLNGKIRYILDGGKSVIGIESTILDLSSDQPRILRKGGVSVGDLEKALDKNILISDSEKEALSPGLKYRHYSPRVAVMLFRNTIDGIAHLLSFYNHLSELGCNIAILCYNNEVDQFPKGAAIAVGKDEEEFAKNYYAILRRIDKEKKYGCILCKTPSDSSLGQALFNRMYKSANSHIIGEIDGNQEIENTIQSNLSNKK